MTWVQLNVANFKIYLNISREREREMFYLTTHSTHFIYGYMASDIWLRTILIVRKETRCRHIGYSFRLTARVLLYAPSHRQDSTYHGLCYTSRGALAGTRNSSMGKYIKDKYIELNLPSELLKQKIFGIDDGRTNNKKPISSAGVESVINLKHTDDIGVVR